MGWRTRLEKTRSRPHIDEPSRNTVEPVLIEPIPDQPAQLPVGPAITVYTSAICGYCSAAKNFLKSKGLQWTEVRIDLDSAERDRMLARARRTSVPQIFIGETHVGG